MDNRYLRGQPKNKIVIKYRMPDIGITGAITPSWARKIITNSNGGEMTGVTVDSSGFVYMCGNYMAPNSITFQGQTLPAGNSASLRVGFYAKFDASGTLQWIKTIKSANSYVRCDKIRVDDTHLFVVGEYVSNAAIMLDNDIGLPISVGIDGYMISISKDNGAASWTQRIGGGNNDKQMGIVTDSDNVYFTGSYSQAITFNASVSLPAVSGTFDGCIIAFNKSTGAAVWAIRVPGTGGEIAYNAAIYNTDLYVSTHYLSSTSQTLQVSPEIILPATKVVGAGRGSSPLLLKITKATGVIAWARYFETDRDLSIAYAVAADSNGVYFGGNYDLNADLNIGNDVVLPASLSDVANNNTAFIIKYNHSGVPQWSRTINTPTGYNNVQCLTTSDGYLYIGGGYFTGNNPTSFNSLVSIPTNASLSGFIFCCTTDGTPIWTDILLNSNNTRVWDIARTSDGIVVGFSQGGYGVTIGNGVIPPSSNGVASPMIVKYLVQNPIISDTNVVTVMADAAAIASNSIAAANIQAITAQVVEANIVQKIADQQAVAVIAKVADVPTTISDTPIVASTDNTVAVKAYVPPTGGATPVAAVAIAVSRVTDPALLGLNLPPGPIPEEITQISIRKFNADGQPIESVIGNKDTYDKVTIKLSTATTGDFQFVHVSNAGVRTTMSSSVNVATATLNEVIALEGAADATVKVLSRSGTEADIELFVPFSTQQQYPAALPCFTAGTKILTPTGYKLIEELKTGDSVMTADGRSVMANVYQRELSRTSRLNAPYHIPAYTLGKRQPKDLTVSPLHAIQIKKGVWEIPADAAQRYPQIKQVGVGEPITYYHIETPNYFRDNLVANGAVVESFGGNQKHRIPANKYLYSYSKVHGGYVRYEPATTRSLTK